MQKLKVRNLFVRHQTANRFMDVSRLLDLPQYQRPRKKFIISALFEIKSLFYIQLLFDVLSSCLVVLPSFFASPVESGGAGCSFTKRAIRSWRGRRLFQLFWSNIKRWETFLFRVMWNRGMIKRQQALTTEIQRRGTAWMRLPLLLKISKKNVVYDVSANDWN